MRLLEKIKKAGYNVSDRITNSGGRVIVITGRGAWVRCVFPPGCDLQTAKAHVAFIQRSGRNLLANIESTHDKSNKT